MIWRFDKKVIFNAPEKIERQDMFKLYMNKIKLSKNVTDNIENNTMELASMTAGLTGADIKTITNHAVMSYVKRSNGNNLIKNEESSKKLLSDQDIVCTDDGTSFTDIIEAIEEVSVGMIKRERAMTEHEKNVVAHHEAGHAMVAYLLKQCSPPIKVSIIPRGEAALGYSQQEPSDKKLYTKEELFAKMCVLLGGRIAEDLSFGQITTGASDDIEKITQIAYNMISVYGMNNSIGELNIMDNNSPYKDTVSQKTKELIDNEVSDLVRLAKRTTKSIINTHKSELDKIANYLLENEEITKNNLEQLFPEEEKSIKDSLDIKTYMDNN